jgi:hypothetical protein
MRCHPLVGANPFSAFVIFKKHAVVKDSNWRCMYSRVVGVYNRIHVRVCGRGSATPRRLPHVTNELSVRVGFA